jgi:hypothetical protein
MKKVLLFASILSICANTIWAQSQRLLLVEECTQASCPPCAAKNPAFNALLSANTNKLVSIKYQVSWPGVDPMNAQNPGEIQARAVYTGAYSVGVPYGVNNGGPLTGGTWTGDPSALTQAKIDSAYAIPSPFNMVLTHWFNAANDSIFIKCVVTCTQAVTMNYPTFQVAMIEKLITFANPPGSNGEKTFEHVMRKMYPDAYGTLMANTSWTVGQTQTFNFKEAMPSYIYQKSEIATVAWIQDDGSKNVKQAAFSPNTNPTGINEAGIVKAFSVYPNPSNGIFTASFEATNNADYIVKVTNALGQVVYEEALNNFSGMYSKEINISSFGKGVYTLTISTPTAIGAKNENVKRMITY